MLNRLLFKCTLVLLWAPSSWGQSLEPSYVSNYGIVCLDETCPDSVGALVAAAPGAVIPSLFCSVTLVGEDRVLTNSHCIPENLRVKGASCTSQIQISFPRTAGSKQADFACAEVEDISTGKGATAFDQFDYAVLKLTTKTGREFSRASRADLVTGAAIHGYPVFYSPFFPIGQIYRVKCTVAELGYLFPQTFHPSAGLFFARGCEFLSQVGNSGTGYLNEAGEYIGLLSAMVHQQFQSASDAAANGSPNILGAKSICIPVFGERSKMCEIPDGDEAFQNATIAYSSLLSFERALHTAALDPLAVQPSKYIQWRQATPQDANESFLVFYETVDVKKNTEYFSTRGFDAVENDMKSLAARVLGQVPACITDSDFAASGGKDVLRYTIFNYVSHELYPGDNGLYLNLALTKELNVMAQSIEIEVSLLSKSDGSGYEIRYEHGSAPLAVPKETSEAIMKVCLKEKQAKEALCEQGHCDLTNQEQKTASLQCQEYFKQWGFSNYLRNFKLQVPRCH